jgi:hypothetical protein
MTPVPSRSASRAAATFDTVCEIALALDGVEEGTAYGSPALKVRGHLMAVVPTHKSAEPNSVALLVGFAERDELIAAEPDVYYVKEHYVDYPVVLARLSRIHSDALRDLVRMAWQFVSKKPRARKRAPKRAGMRARRS